MKQLLGICRMPLGRVGVFLLAFLLAIMPMTPAFANNDDIPETMSYEVGDQVIATEEEYSNLYFQVLDPEGHTVGIGANFTNSSSGTNGDGFIDANLAMGPESSHSVVVPASITDSDGTVWSVKQIGHYAFAAASNSSSNETYLSEIIVLAQLDYVGTRAFMGDTYHQLTISFEGEGCIKEIESSALRYAYREAEYPEGSTVVQNDGYSFQSTATTDLGYPLSHNGEIYIASWAYRFTNDEWLQKVYVRSPYASITSTIKSSSYSGSGADSSVRIFYIWADSNAEQTFNDYYESNISTSKSSVCMRAQLRNMAVLSEESYTPAATKPDYDTDTYIGKSNTVIEGIVDGETYLNLPQANIYCIGNEATESYATHSGDGATTYSWTLTEGVDFEAVYYDASGNQLDSAPVDEEGSFFVEYVGNEKTSWGTSRRYAFNLSGSDLSKAEVTHGSTDLNYSGSPQAPSITVTLEGYEMEQGVAYDMTYVGKDVSYYGEEAPTNPGSYTAIVRTTESTMGGVLAYVDFTIESLDLSECTITVENCEASSDGSAVEPVITVSDSDGNSLSHSAYVVSYKDAEGNPLDASDLVNVGTYVVIVSGDGIGSFNSNEASFAIVNVDMILISASAEDVVFTGKAVAPSFDVRAQNDEAIVVDASNYIVSYYEAVSDDVESGEPVYIKGDEISADELVEVGVYIAVIKAVGTDYAGTVQCVFEIVPQEVTDVSAVTVNRTDYDYIPSRYWLDPDTPILRSETAILRGEYITPDVTVTLDDGTELVEGVDYTLSCVNNTGDDRDNYAQLNKWTAAFTVELCGNYSGTIGTIDENDYANSTFVFYISQRQRVYEYHGIRFTYAIDNDGNAILTGLDEDKGTDDAFTDAFDGETAYIPDTIVTAEGDIYPVDRVAENAFSGYGISDPQFPTRNTPTWESATKLVVEGIREVDSTGTAGNITELELQEGIEVIGCGAISWGSTNVPDIVIPSSVVAIGSNAFGGNNQTTAVLNSVTFVQPSSFTTYFPQVGTTTDSGEYRYWMPDSVVSYPLFTAGTNAGSPGTITTFTIPASFKGNDACLFDRAVTLTDVYVLADDYDPSRSPVDARVEMNLWGWDVEGSGVYEISQSTTYDFVWSPFAVLGDGYVYTNAWNEETQCCDGEQFYDSNVSLVDADVTTTSDEVVIDWDFDYNYVNKSSRTISEGEDFTVTYVKEGTDEVLEEITEPGTYTATLTGNGINCFGTDSIVIEVPAAGEITDSDVFVSADGLTYTGSALEPAVTVSVDGALLARGTDYEISYANNVYAGTATVTVTGIGLYEGSVTTTFDIAKAQASVKAADLSKAYGADDPTFIWVDVEGLVAGDQLLSATFSRAPGEDAGEYAITMTDAVIVGDGVVVSDCYDITYAPGTLTILPASESANANTMNVYAGDDRYDTASRINSSVAEEGPYAGVIVCSGANGKFADALAASGLSGVLDYPIVLTDGSAATLPADTAQSISALTGGAQANIIVLGGEGTVSSGIYSALSAYGTVDRIAGDDRYATAEAVYEYGTTHGGWSTDYAVLAIGNNFPDALGAASFCTTYGAPMLLTNSNDDSLAGYITEAASAVSEVVIVGGESSVSASKEAALKGVCSNVERMAGDSRYDTNVAFASWQIAHGMTADGAGIATGANFPDSLGSSYLLSLTSSVLLLASSDEAENAGLYALLSDNADAVTSVSVLGGPNSVTATTRLATQTTVGGAWVNVNK